MQVRANGLSFHVNRFRSGPAGDRPVVVCVHGLAVVDNASSSFVLGFHLATDAEVITYDLRGHGRSSAPSSGYGVADHAEDLLALIDALGIARPVHLVGFSYGGAITMLAAMRAPERIASVTLLDGHVPVAGWEDALFGLVKDFARWQQEAETRGLTGEQFEDLVIERVIDRFRATPRRAAAVARRVRRLFESTTLREDMRNETVFDKEDFSRIDCPVLGIYGDQSDLYWLTDRLPALVRDVTIHTIPGADHVGVFWRIDEIRPLIREFIGLPGT